MKHWLKKIFSSGFTFFKETVVSVLDSKVLESVDFSLSFLSFSDLSSSSLTSTEFNGFFISIALEDLPAVTLVDFRVPGFLTSSHCFVMASTSIVVEILSLTLLISSSRPELEIPNFGKFLTLKDI